MSCARSRFASCGLLAVLVGVAFLFLFFVPAGASPITVTNDSDVGRRCADGITDSSSLANGTSSVVNRVVPDEAVCSTLDRAVSSLTGQSLPHGGVNQRSPTRREWAAIRHNFPVPDQNPSRPPCSPVWS